jgi:drug/metabolite transporter (DMT)-like permease
MLTLLATLSVSVGEALLSIGMKQISKSGAEGLKYVLAAASNPRVLLGTALMAAFFAVYAHTLSGADFSFVLPLTAMSFLFGALLAHFYLQEHVSATRWAGTLIIMLGVGVVVFGEQQSQPRQAAVSAPAVETAADVNRSAQG